MYTLMYSNFVPSVQHDMALNLNLLCFVDPGAHTFSDDALGSDYTYSQSLLTISHQLLVMLFLLRTFHCLLV